MTTIVNVRETEAENGLGTITTEGKTMTIVETTAAIEEIEETGMKETATDMNRAELTLKTQDAGTKTAGTHLASMHLFENCMHTDVCSSSSKPATKQVDEKPAAK